MSMEYIRNYYKVPARHGRRVRYCGGREARLGTIVSASGGHLNIRLDGQRHTLPYHPTWKLEYLPDQGDQAPLSMWVITENPTDCPGQFVARQWLIDGQEQAATTNVRVANTLEAVREMLPPFLTQIPRDASDDRVIVESWI